MCNLNIRKVLQSNGCIEAITCTAVCTQLLKSRHEVAAHLCKESFVCGGWVVRSKVCSYEEVLGVDWQLQHIGAWWSRQQDVLPCTHTGMYVCTLTTVQTHTTHTSTQHKHTQATNRSLAVSSFLSPLAPSLPSAAPGPLQTSTIEERHATMNQEKLDVLKEWEE